MSIAPGLPPAAGTPAGTPEIERGGDWLLANPWPWLAAGLGVTFWSFLWTLVFGDTATDYRVVVLAFGILFTGVGVWLRWNDRNNVYLGPNSLAGVRVFLGCLFGILFLLVTGYFAFSWTVDSPQLRPGPLSLVWITIAPAMLLAARRCFTTPTGDRQRESTSETAFVFVVAAGICLLGSFTLQLPGDMTDWDSIRLVLRLLVAGNLLGAALTLLAPAARRIVVSVYFLLHFAGILNACLAAPPAPWLVQQTWIRLFRPYLEFMYLNNAYHFYAPEPGPASYLWFRLIYENENRHEVGWWYKVPQIDDRGRLKHTVALEYQRFLTLTESLALKDNPPATFVLDEQGQPMVNPFYARRLSLVPSAGVVLGKEKSTLPLIPLHPGYSSEAAQTSIPAAFPKQLLSSFARCVVQQFGQHPEPEFEDYKFKSVKIYRVIHAIPGVADLRNGISPTDPAFYHAFFVGNYDATGRLIEDQDPYRYWILPAQRVDPFDPDSAIRDYARLHAGDPHWYRPRGKLTWEAPPGR